MHLIAHGSVQTPLESLHWKLTLGEKSLDPPGICVPVLCSTNWATSPPLDLDLISRSQGIRRKKMQVEFLSKFLPDKAQTWHICWDFLRIMCTLPWVALACPRSGEPRTQKLKSHLERTHSLNILLLKPGVGQYIAIHATLTATVPGISSLLISTLPVHSPAFLRKPLAIFFLVLAVVNTGSCIGPQNKIGHPVGCRFLRFVPAEYKWGFKKWRAVWWLVKWMTWR